MDLLFCQKTGGFMCGCRSGVRVEGIISLSDCGYFLSTGGIDDIYRWRSPSGRRFTRTAPVCSVGGTQAELVSEASATSAL